MTANVMDQAKEIAVLRSLGYTKTRIKMLYFYEAFILVMSSSSLGVIIGTIVGSVFML
jgi:ABC-type lipoprotein release transport system permease subunit